MRLLLPRAVFAGLLVLTTVLLLSPQPELPPNAPDDKVGHLLTFAALALAGLWARVPAAPLVVGLAAYAGATELLQAVLPVNRHGDPRDFVADLGGLLAGVTAGALLSRARARRRAPG